jgi:hypothetical protein
MKNILFTAILLIVSIFAVHVNSKPLVISSSFGIFKEDNSIVFYGEITNSAAFNLIEVLSLNNPSSLVMISPGGYMPAALLIGEYIRESGVTVVIRENTQCISACAYAAIGSVNLEINGDLLFHSPYFPTISTTDTISDLFVMSNLATLTMIQWVISNGYTIEFYSEILNLTDLNTFINFTSVEDLYRFKNTDPLDVLESPDQYYTVIALE